VSDTAKQSSLWVVPMLRVASVLAVAAGFITFFTAKKSIGPPHGAFAYMPVMQGVEHDWLGGTVYFLAFMVLACLCLGIAELVRLVSETRTPPE
jgi:hypothetical protein